LIVVGYQTLIAVCVFSRWQQCWTDWWKVRGDDDYSFLVINSI